MIPKRIAAKFFATDANADVDFDAFIGVFHEFVREKSVEGVLIDVADYGHVPEGPGVVLIGHDVDYSIDLNEGRAGLLTVGKRLEGGTVAEHLDDTVRKCLLAVKAVQANGSSGTSFSTAAVKVQVVDRLAAPNSDDGFAACKGEFEALATRVFGDGASVERADADEARKPLAATITGASAEDLDTLLARLER
jgi:hypothetical protein